MSHLQSTAIRLKRDTSVLIKKQSQKFKERNFDDDDDYYDDIAWVTLQSPQKLNLLIPRSIFFFPREASDG
jgi:predicted alpha-1,6-mannanase (GH76 family)